MSSPDELDPADLDAQWKDLVSQLGAEPTVSSTARSTPIGAGPRDYYVEEDDGRFVPPEPESHVFKPRSVLGWFLIVVGLAGIVIVSLTNASAAVGVFSGLIGMAGLVVLVMGLPEHRDSDDDGAQV